MPLVHAGLLARRTTKTTEQPVIRKNVLAKVCLVATGLFAPLLWGQNVAAVSIQLPADQGDGINLLVLLTILALAPSILILTTGFTRILIVLSFVRNALGLQQMPPNQILIGLALILELLFHGSFYQRDPS